MHSGCCYPTGTMHLHNQSLSVIPACVAPPASTPHTALWLCQALALLMLLPAGGGGLPYVQITMAEAS